MEQLINIIQFGEGNFLRTFINLMEGRMGAKVIIIYNVKV
ncbi:MAG: hypothetical protein K0R00_4022 [Herbinix sp.]|jgi:mannitol-1-phosphate/altronate dehydrogenase|nr:hypothetical protein [Herbinix sp.]